MKLATGFLAITISLSVGCVTDTAETQEVDQSLLGDSMGFMVDMATGTPVPGSEWRIDQGSWGEGPSDRYDGRVAGCVHDLAVRFQRAGGVSGGGSR